MICQRNVASYALGHVRTLFAARQRGKPAPVVKDDSLPFIGQSLFHGSRSSTRYQRIRSKNLELTCHIHDFHFGQPHTSKPFGKFHKAVTSRQSLVISFDRRRRTAKQHFRTVHSCQHDSGITGVIAWCWIKLLVARLMLLIHNDQTKAMKRKKH